MSDRRKKKAAGFRMRMLKISITVMLLMAGTIVYATAVKPMLTGDQTAAEPLAAATTSGGYEEVPVTDESLIRQVRNAAEFREALLDASVEKIVFTADINMNDGTITGDDAGKTINVETVRNSKQLIVDGDGHSPTEHFGGYSNYGNNIRVRSAGLDAIVLKNMTIHGINYYGTFYFSSSKTKGMVLKYDNVDYIGNQPVYAKYATFHAKDSTFTQYNYYRNSATNTTGAGEMLGQVASLVLEGDIEATRQANSAHNIVWIYRRSGHHSYEFRVKEGANVVINDSGGSSNVRGIVRFYHSKGSMILEDNASMEVTRTRFGNFTHANTASAYNLTIGRGASLDINTTGTIYSATYGGTYLSSLTMQPDSRFHYINNGNATAGKPVISLRGNVVMTNPDSVFWYNSRNTAPAYRNRKSNITMDITSQRIDTWKSSSEKMISGKFDVVDNIESVSVPAYTFQNQDPDTLFNVFINRFSSASSNKPRNITSQQYTGLTEISANTFNAGTTASSTYSVFRVQGLNNPELAESEASAEITYQLVDENGTPTPDSMDTLIGYDSFQATVVPDPERYLIDEDEEEGEEEEDEEEDDEEEDEEDEEEEPEVNYVLDIQMSNEENTKNTKFSVDTEDASVTFTYDKSEVQEITFFYGIDADGDGIPDYRGGSVSEFEMLIDENGVPGDKTYVETHTPADDSVTEGTTLPKGYDGTDFPYLFDLEQTLQENAGAVSDEFFNIDETDHTVTFTYGSMLNFTLVYALDANGDGVPDYKESYNVQQYYQLVDENGSMMDSPVHVGTHTSKDGTSTGKVTADIPEEGYIYDYTTTIDYPRNSADLNFDADEPAVTFRYNEVSEFTFVFAADLNENSIPDYLEGSADEQHILLNGDGDQEIAYMIETHYGADQVSETFEPVKDLYTDHGGKSYVFDLAGTIAQNSSNIIVDDETGAITVTLSNENPPEFNFVYALDSGGNGIPDYREITITEYHEMIDENGVNHGHELIRTHTGEIGTVLELDADEYNGYILDVEPTERYNAAAIRAGLFDFQPRGIPAADENFTVTLTFDEALSSFTLVYGSDRDGDGIPDYRKAETIEKHVLIDAGGTAGKPSDYITRLGQYGEIGNAYLYEDLYKEDGYVLDWTATLTQNETSVTVSFDKESSTVRFQFGVTPSYYVYYAKDENGNGIPDYQEGYGIEYHVFIDAAGETYREIEINRHQSDHTINIDALKDHYADPSDDYANHLIYDYDKTKLMNEGVEQVTVQREPLSNNGETAFTDSIVIEADWTEGFQFYIAFAIDANNDADPDYTERKVYGFAQLFDADGNYIYSSQSPVADGEAVDLTDVDKDDEDNVYFKIGGGYIPDRMDDYIFDLDITNELNDFYKDWIRITELTEEDNSIGPDEQLREGLYMIISGDAIGRINAFIAYSLDSDGDGIPDYKQYQADGTRLLLDSDGFTIIDNSKTYEAKLVHSQNGLTVTADESVTLDGHRYLYDMQATTLWNHSAFVTATEIGVNISPALTSDVSYNLVYVLDRDEDGTPDYRQGHADGTMQFIDAAAEIAGSRELERQTIRSDEDLVIAENATQSFENKTYIYDQLKTEEANKDISSSILKVTSDGVVITKATSGTVEYVLIYALDEDGDGVPDYRQKQAFGTIEYRDADDNLAGSEALNTQIISTKTGLTITAEPSRRYHGYDYNFSRAETDEASYLTDDGIEIPADVSQDVEYTFIYTLDPDSDGTFHYSGTRYLFDKDKNITDDSYTYKEQVIEDADITITAEEVEGYIYDQELTESCNIGEAAIRVSETGLTIERDKVTDDVHYILAYAIDEDVDEVPDYRQKRASGTAEYYDNGIKTGEETLEDQIISTKDGLIITADPTRRFDGYSYNFTHAGASDDTYVNGDTIMIPADTAYDVTYTFAYELDSSKERQIILSGTQYLLGEDQKVLEDLTREYDDITMTTENIAITAAEAAIDTEGYTYDSIATSSYNSDVNGVEITDSGIKFLADKITTDTSYILAFGIDSDGDEVPDYQQFKALGTIVYLDEDGETQHEETLEPQLISAKDGLKLTAEATRDYDGKTYVFTSAEVSSGGSVADNIISIPADVTKDTDYTFLYTEESDTGNGGGPGTNPPAPGDISMYAYGLLIDETGTPDGNLQLLNSYAGEAGTNRNITPDKVVKDSYIYDLERTQTLNAEVSDLKVNNDGTIDVTFGAYPFFTMVYAFDADGNGIPDYKESVTTEYHVFLDGDGNETTRRAAETYTGAYGSTRTVSIHTGEYIEDHYVYDEHMTRLQNVEPGKTVNGSSISFTLGQNKAVYIYFALDVIGSEDGDGDGIADYQQNKAVGMIIYLDEEGQLLNSIRRTSALNDSGLTITVDHPVTHGGHNFAFDAEASGSLNGSLQQGSSSSGYTIRIPGNTESAIYYLVYGIDEKGGSKEGDGDGIPDYLQYFARGYDVLIGAHADDMEYITLPAVEIGKNGANISYSIDKYISQNYIFDGTATEIMNNYYENVLNETNKTIWVPSIHDQPYYVVYALDDNEGGGNGIPDYREAELFVNWLLVQADDSITLHESITLIGEMGQTDVVKHMSNAPDSEKWILDEERSGSKDGVIEVTFGTTAEVNFYYTPAKDDNGGGNGGGNGGNGGGNGNGNGNGGGNDGGNGSNSGSGGNDGSSNSKKITSTTDSNSKKSPSTGDSTNALPLILFVLSSTGILYLRKKHIRTSK